MKLAARWKPAHIEVHLVAPSELPDDTDAAFFVAEDADEIRADLYCNLRAPAAARAVAPLCSTP